MEYVTKINVKKIKVVYIEKIKSKMHLSIVEGWVPSDYPEPAGTRRNSLPFPPLIDR